MRMNTAAAGTRSNKRSRSGWLRSCRGMTLVELLIALVLSLLLSVAIVQLFIGNKKTFMLQESTARLQENGRFALAFIAADIRGSGYAGCVSDREQINNTLAGEADSHLWGFTRLVQGFDAAGDSWDPDWGAAEYDDFDFDSAIAGTDIITLHTVGGLTAKATQTGNFMDAGIEDIELLANPGMEAGDVIFITDCDKGAITQITGLDDGAVQHAAAGDSPGNATAELGHVFADAEVFEVRATSYFIAPDASGQPALWRKIDEDAPQELIQGVEDMQLLYGVADDVEKWGTVSRYITAADVASEDAWDKVAAVRIRLLFQSNDNVLEQAQTYSFNGADVEAGDKRVRREFTTTIGVRNRIL